MNKQSISNFVKMNKQSISNFVKISNELRIKEEYKESMALACIAFASCSRNEYPDHSDKKRFVQLLKDNFSQYCSIGLPGISASTIMIFVEEENKHITHITYEEMIYKYVRCHLIHEAELPSIKFSKEVVIADYNADTKLPITMIDMLNQITLNYLNSYD